MKSQRLVSSYTPSAIQEWLEQELEKRGIDSVYARSILSLLQQDYVDVEPHECHQTRNRQLKVLHKSASDYVDDVEKLIDEVWLRLKNTSLNADQEEMAIRKCNTLGQSFYIPPSSPTDDMEKYFASFPPLSSNTELAVKSVQPKFLKNDWCKKCILKKKI
ncbi:uncharacterized protein CEXT_481581 [Caerostris extrusa]|uniref:Uncharacterized protein n=1 Tax=Caerostris extrusa TaxID=172846 RepID=A0AAV4YBS2_CAEEX|nr:uncharacterized protein CEXT_481581 [Caerostris extrusa]